MTVQLEKPRVCLASIALEPNRWKKPELRVPSLRVSEWSARAAAAGFHAWELWEHHYHRADETERRALRRQDLPVDVFNTYLLPGIDADEDWTKVAGIVAAFGPGLRGIKFNLGKEEHAPVEAQVEAALRWADLLPRHVRLWCECHGGTVLETPEAAAAAFARWPKERFAAILHPLNPDPDHCKQWMNALDGRIEHLHWQGRDEENRMCALADKRGAVETALHTLRGLGFGGSHCIEFVAGTGRPEETVEKDFEAAVADLEILNGLLEGS